MSDSGKSADAVSSPLERIQSGGSERREPSNNLSKLSLVGTNTRNLELSAAFFEECGYEVSSESIRENDSGRPVDVSVSLALVDVDVFSDSLREVYERFRDAGVPVVLLLGTVTPNARERAARDGIVDVHEKPLRKRELRSLVDSRVGGVSA